MLLRDFIRLLLEFIREDNRKRALYISEDTPKTIGTKIRGG